MLVDRLWRAGGQVSVRGQVQQGENSCVYRAECPDQGTHLIANYLGALLRQRSLAKRISSQAACLEHVCCMLLSVYSPVTCNPSRAVTESPSKLPTHTRPPSRRAFPAGGGTDTSRCLSPLLEQEHDGTVMFLF